MADNDNNGEGTTSRGADWEVVQLTASTYAAAPGPEEPGSADETKESENATQHESSSAMIVSGHFVFPPSDHENLPIEPEVSEIRGESESLSTEGSHDNGSQKLDKESLQTGSEIDPYQLEVSEDRGSINYMAYTAGKEIQTMNLDEGEALLDDTQPSDYYEAYGSQYEQIDPSGETPETPREHAKGSEEEENDGSNLPDDAWWKRHATSVYRHAKEGNTFWSIVVAATVVGLVILGHRWQRSKWQFHENKWRFCVADERISRMLTRYK